MIIEKKFDAPLSRDALDLKEKARTSVFPWRGQFSPELIANIYNAYCSQDAVVLDPFCGSGTVLYEAGLTNLQAIGIELNPAAYLLSKTYELINLKPDELAGYLSSFILKIENTFSISSPLDASMVFDYDLKIEELKNKLNNVEKVLLNAFIILLNIDEEKISITKIDSALSKISNAVRDFPHSDKSIGVVLGDSRDIPLDKETIDFVVTSPPYINVFNYHQNYRKSAEYLGWDLLKIARSEIGSNRANRGNRFLTVIQYCIDMELTLNELHRVLKDDGKMIFVVGHQSNVLGVPFYNAKIITEIAIQSGLFDLVLVQSREFKNKFGKMIREDLLHLRKLSVKDFDKDVGRQIASKELTNGLVFVEEKNNELLLQAIQRCKTSTGTPVYTNQDL